KIVRLVGGLVVEIVGQAEFANQGWSIVHAIERVLFDSRDLLAKHSGDGGGPKHGPSLIDIDRDIGVEAFGKEGRDIVPMAGMHNMRCVVRLAPRVSSALKGLIFDEDQSFGMKLMNCGGK